MSEPGGGGGGGGTLMIFDAMLAMLDVEAELPAQLARSTHLATPLCNTHAWDISYITRVRGLVTNQTLQVFYVFAEEEI